MISGTTPTPPSVVQCVLDLAAVRPADVVLDMGCGDGRIVIAAAKRGIQRAIGIDNNPERIAAARAAALNAGVQDRVEFILGDLFAADVSIATVVTLYQTPEVNLALAPTLLRKMPIGGRIVSHSYDFGDWRPNDVARHGDRTVYLWVVPEDRKAPAWNRSIDASFRCEDLSWSGAYLVRADTEEYEALLNDVPREDLANVGDAPFSAFLVNRSASGIAALAYEWSFRSATGTSSTRQFSRSILSQQWRTPWAPDSAGAWGGAIPPGGKWILADRSSFCICRARDSAWVDPVLRLDGVFFTDGSFVGANRLRLWEWVFYRLEVFRNIGRLISSGRERGNGTAAILREVAGYLDAEPQSLPGTEPSSPGEFLVRERAGVSRLLADIRKRQGDESVAWFLLASAAATYPALQSAPASPIAESEPA
jgi:SAM-dependent methyltransferase